MVKKKVLEERGLIQARFGEVKIGKELGLDLLVWSCIWWLLPSSRDSTVNLSATEFTSVQ